ARRSLARNQSLRNNRSAAAENRSPAPGWVDPASSHRTAGTSLPQTHRNGSPPAAGSNAHKKGDSDLAPACGAQSRSFPAVSSVCDCPWPCPHCMSNWDNCKLKVTVPVYTSRNDFHHGLLVGEQVLGETVALHLE